MIDDDENADDIDHITSYCVRCESFGFLSELGPRVYPDNESIPLRCRYLDAMLPLWNRSK